MSTLIRNNWFWPAAMILVAAAWAISTVPPVPLDPGFELALLVDALITLPVLFILCYRRSLKTGALVFRVLALQCAGIWLAAKLIPTDSQSLLSYLAWVRWAGLAIILLFEVRLVAAVVKLQFKRTIRQEEFEAAGMPPLLAKLAMLEARFWRWVLRRPKP